MAIRNWKDIPLFKDVTDEQWNDWHWQVAHRLSTTDEIAQVINLTPEEREEIAKVIGMVARDFEGNKAEAKERVAKIVAKYPLY